MRARAALNRFVGPRSHQKAASRRKDEFFFLTRGLTSSAHRSSSSSNNHNNPGPLSAENDARVVLPKVTQHSSAFSSSSTTTHTTAAIVDLEHQSATELVDHLLERTRRLMMTAPCASEEDAGIIQQQDLHHHHFHHIIAFSGGVDSSLVAALVHRNVVDLNGIGGQQPTQQQQHQFHTATAVLGVSPAVPEEQIAAARRVARDIIGIGTGDLMDWCTVPTREGDRATYVANTGRACYACKTELYATLQAVHRHGLEQQQQRQQRQKQQQVSSTSSSAAAAAVQYHLQLYNGTNADDLRDPTRLGLVAAAQFHVRSPLDRTTKEDVRRAARHLGLPNWQAAASPCLRSRLAWGVPATRRHLQRVGAAERFVRQQLAAAACVPISDATNLRVRLLPRQAACLEIDADVVEAARAMYAQQRDAWEAYLLGELAFASFAGVRAFRSGSVATTTTTTVVEDADEEEENMDSTTTTTTKEAYAF